MRKLIDALAGLWYRRHIQTTTEVKGNFRVLACSCGGTIHVRSRRAIQTEHFQQTGYAFVEAATCPAGLWVMKKQLRDFPKATIS